MTITTRAPSRLLVLLVVVGVFSLLLLVSAVQATDRIAATEVHEVHEVQAGETLWDIAATVTRPGGDVRATVFDLKRLNDLDGSVIVPGQVLTVPTGG